MKYYAKMTNMETGKTGIFPSPNWTKKSAALNWANEFMKLQKNAKVVIVAEHEK